MRRPVIFAIGLAVMFIFSVSDNAMATIGAIQSDLCPNGGCLPCTVHPIVVGKSTSMVVKGQYVDLSTSVEISGPAQCRHVALQVLLRRRGENYGRWHSIRSNSYDQSAAIKWRRRLAHHLC